MMNDSSLIHVPLPINVFRYEFGSIMLKERDFMDFIDQKKISVTYIDVYIK